MKRIFISLLVITLVLNRVLLAYDTYKLFSQERVGDINLFDKLCIDGNIMKNIGKHKHLCDEIKHRLSSHVIFHVFRYVTNDTLYRELTVQNIVQIACIVVTIYIMDSFVRHYSFTNIPELPIIKNQKRLKIE